MALFRFEKFTLKKGTPNLMRREVLERDHYTCRGCFTPQIYQYTPNKRTMFGVSDYCTANINLEVHHIVKRPIGLDEPNNLITLCRRCHEDVQHDIDPYYNEKYLQKYFYKVGMKAIVSRCEKSEILRKQGLLSADFEVFART